MPGISSQAFSAPTPPIAGDSQSSVGDATGTVVDAQRCDLLPPGELHGREDRVGELLNRYSC